MAAKTVIAGIGGYLPRQVVTNDDLYAGAMPTLRADYTTVRNKAYTESGAGALSLAVQAQSTNQFLLAVDGKLTHEFSNGLLLAGNLGVGYDFLAKNSRVVSTFVGGGASFATEGLGNQHVVAYGGLALTLLKSRSLELTARYDVEARRAFTNQSVSLRLVKKF